MRKAVPYLIVIFLLNGCGFRDIDKRFFVVAIGVDVSEKTNKAYKVTLELAIPSPTIKPGEAKHQLISIDADSVSEAVRVLQSKVDKELNFGQCRIILLGNSLVIENHKEIIEWLQRRREISGSSYMAIGKPTAESVLSTHAKSERLPANALVLSFEEIATTSPYVLQEVLLDFYVRYWEKGIDPYLPIIEPDQEKFKINKVGLYQDKKMKVTLNPNQTQILSELQNQTRTVIDVKDSGKDFYVTTDKVKTNINMKFNKYNRPSLDVNLKLEGIIEESHEYLRNQNLKKLENLAEETLEKRVKKLLIFLQEEQVDPLGFALEYSSLTHNPLNIQEWKSVYEDLDINVRAQIRLKGTGTMY
ncbi:Ger(x)C family spore germination protein [Neobacillus niacini]|uniref:Ger(x)C family spore germination protein n=1 Tax=Neobacillus niacini TaxID=86668 RepID=UPI0007ABD9F6|nr:Ger(x)C family spore germination protein [Neobacillus niacini]MEC1526046.1 Ger(x)C family spore germination protein [Neobacillus niacini]